MCGGRVALVPTYVGTRQCPFVRNIRHWQRAASGTPLPTHVLRSELDAFIAAEGNGVRAIVEVKQSDWDRMTPRAVRRNVKR